MPDYANGTPYSTSSFVAPDNGWVESAGSTNAWGILKLLSDGIDVDSSHNNTGNNGVLRFTRGFVSKGSTVSKSGADANLGYMNFFPTKKKKFPSNYVIKY